MKIKLVLVALLALLTCSAFAQQEDPTDKPQDTVQAPAQDPLKDKSQDDPQSKPDKPADKRAGGKSIPVLGDLPIIGNFFQATGDNQDLATVLSWADFNSTEMEKRVNLDVTDMPVREALKLLCDQVKLKFEAEKDIPDDAKVTLKLNNVRFTTALNALTETAGLGWQQQYKVKDNKVDTTLKVGKNIKTRFSTFPFFSGNQVFSGNQNDVLKMNKVDPKIFNNFNNVLPNGKITNPLLANPDGKQRPLMLDAQPNSIFNVLSQEERHTFTCPHCKQQVTILDKHEAPKCEKCGRIFQSNWQFCPYDGAKRPADPEAWQFCPHCGKRVTP